MCSVICNAYTRAHAYRVRLCACVRVYMCACACVCECVCECVFVCARHTYIATGHPIMAKPDGNIILDPKRNFCLVNYSDADFLLSVFPATIRRRWGEAARFYIVISLWTIIKQYYTVNIYMSA